MKAAKRIATNTAILYIRLIITAGIAFYTTRLILAELGSADYGIFSLLIGIVLMLSFLNPAMAASTQRFLSFYQGSGEVGKEQETFSNSFILHAVIGLLVVLLLAGIGPFLFSGFLNIPADRIPASKTVYTIMMVMMFINIVAVPFQGLLVSREQMGLMAVVAISESLLKLGAALLLPLISQDKLVVFSLLTAAISVTAFLFFAIYCTRAYPTMAIKKQLVNLAGIRKLAGFTGWNSFGTFCILARTQGLAIILNLFFGPLVNASYAIANQINSQFLFFSGTMIKALNPQIMKSEGAGDRKRMLRLSLIGSKSGLFLLSFIAIPCLFEMETLIGIWLKETPAYTITFCQLILIGSLCKQLTVGLQSAIQAGGEIRHYHLIIGAILLLNVPLAYLLIISGVPPPTVMLSYIGIELVACAGRIIVSNKAISLQINGYLRKVVYKGLVPVTLYCILCFAITYFFNFPGRFVLTFTVLPLIFITTVYYFGLDADERALAGNMMSDLRKRPQQNSSIL